MFYFFPSLHNKTNSWEDRDPMWFENNSALLFDDFLSYVRMFSKGKEESILFIPTYSPNLRNYLYRKNIKNIKVISLFDVMQNISSNLETFNFDYRKLNWPKNTNFIYSPFAIFAYLFGDKFARILHGEDGNIIKIEFYRKNVVYKSAIFDDRGFISRIDAHDKEGSVYEKRFFNDIGDIQFVERKDGSVILYNGEKEEDYYDNISSLIRKSIKRYFHIYGSPNDVVVAAADMFYMKHIIRSTMDYKIILYCSSSRKFDYNWVIRNSHHINGIILDSNKYLDNMTDIFDRNVVLIPPLDIRLSYSKGIQKHYQRIALKIDDLTNSSLLLAVETIIKLVTQHDDVYLAIFTYNGFNVSKLRNIIIDIGEGKFMLKYSDKQDDKKGETNKYCINYYNIQSELEVVSFLKESDLLIDIADSVDIPTQIIGLSLGIPQINTCFSGYVDNNINGKIISSLGKELYDAMSFYLFNIENRNTSLVHSSNKMRKYHDRNIINILEGLINEK
ncbi:accessory Sec system protein Asp1 [Pediococcus acidilactici]|uniref:accessory Sec system protein Asp1 n=1 Tax=Pediococcus acidilactici TaxID=1254 RepID=UPI00270A1A22|nr:accessory Sec system protein Asp1 [Pediococcus acidilactici]MDO7803142.1 accessory Sec system protein Asp1 [Pediococcus acidilactici]